MAGPTHIGSVGSTNCTPWDFFKKAWHWDEYIGGQGSLKDPEAEKYVGPGRVGSGRWGMNMIKTHHVCV